MLPLKVGVGLARAQGGSFEGLRQALDQVARAGLDYVSFGDHVSFHTGRGTDGLITATALAMMHPTLPVFVSVYLLPLRHPVPVARQLATLAQNAPGRLIFGVGIGGEDRHEVEICGVDPATRGRRMNESLEVLRGLLAGEVVSFKGEFFEIERASILPAPSPPIPIVVGGRSNAAVRRAGRFGDGWLGIWNSARRFKEAVALAEETAAQAGRRNVQWQHGMQFWCGFGPSREEARAGLARSMQDTYRIPFERFERYSPYGSPEEVAEFLAPYREAGCTSFNIGPIAPSPEEAIAAVAEVKRLLSTVP